MGNNYYKKVNVVFNEVKGFSLVELSISIAVISLIIGGVILGSDILRAVELKAIMAEANDYRAAIQQFEATYGGLPGDLSMADDFWNGTDNGNGDGEVVEHDETVLAADHLELAEFVEGNFTPTWGGGFSFSEPGNAGNTISSQSSGSGALRLVCCSTLDDAGRSLDFDNHLNFFTISPYDQSERNGIVSPVEAWGIDLKMDDGNPDLGDVGASGGMARGDNTANISRCFVNRGAAADYQTDDSDLKDGINHCQMLFKYN